MTETPPTSPTSTQPAFTTPPGVNGAQAAASPASPPPVAGGIPHEIDARTELVIRFSESRLLRIPDPLPIVLAMDEAERKNAAANPDQPEALTAELLEGYRAAMGEHGADLNSTEVLFTARAISQWARALGKDGAD